MARRHRHDYEKIKRDGVLASLWKTFWSPPGEVCPRCGSRAVEYYDPFFFSPIRTLQGRRRIKCPACRFVWRPSRRGNSVVDRLNPFKTNL